MFDRRPEEFDKRVRDLLAPLGPGAPPRSPQPLSPGQWAARLLVLPFSPSLWAQAGWLPVGPTLASVYLYTIIASVAIGFTMSGQFIAWLDQWGKGYDRDWSPIVVSAAGEVRVEGDRPFRKEVEGTLYALDVEGDLDPDKSGYRNYIIVGRTEIVEKTGLSRQTIKVKDIAALFGGREIRIDGASIQAFAKTYEQILIMAGVAVIGAAFTALGWASAPLYALIAGLFAHSIAGRAKGVPPRTCFKIALAAVAAKAVIELFLGAAFDLRFAFPIYTAAVTGLTLLALGRIPSPGDRPGAV